MSDQLDAVLARIDADLDASLARLFTFLKIQSVSTDPAYAPHCRAAAEYVAKDLATLGFATEVRPTGGHPVVTAKHGNGAGPRALFYGHYDVQPVDPVELWDNPPFEPRLGTLPDGRKVITARGACDDKGQVMTFVEACRAYKAVTGKLPLAVTMLIEGEEECGSKNLPAFLQGHAAELDADLALVCDTGMWDPRTPAITTSLRGLVYDEVKIIAADRDLHSGLFGGAAQNPIRVLCKVLAAIHDDQGRITIPGFYDGVEELPPAVREQWEALDFRAESFLGQVGLGVPAGEKGRLLIEQVASRPACDVNGIIGGYTGEGSKTVIPAQASAKVSFRLVGGQEPEKIRDAFRAFVRTRLPADCKAEFISHAAAPALSLDWGMPQLVAARAALAQEWGRDPVLVGAGGSIPIVAEFKRLLGIDTLLIGFALDDDRVHSPNEKYDLTSFHKGMRSWARVLAALGDRG
jgi:acetylornithine deacetylase/succinyl-diaminopimelate desuccinylase-like protein